MSTFDRKPFDVNSDQAPSLDEWGRFFRWVTGTVEADLAVMD
jgi:hypothetical protein